MPLIEAAGTNVARIRPDSVKNSMPPERIWLSMSVSEPSWLFGKICRSNLPLVSVLIAAAISLARAFSGWESGRLLAYLYENSADCARATNGAPTLELTTDAADAFSSVRREKLISILPGHFLLVAGSHAAYCSVRRRSQYRLSDEAAITGWWECRDDAGRAAKPPKRASAAMAPQES